jgi:hypothetical protein
MDSTTLSPYAQFHAVLSEKCPGISLYDRDHPIPQRTANPKQYAPLFDWDATQRLAKRAGFDPTQPGAAADILEEMRCNWMHPPGAPEDLRYQGHFYLALGFWLHDRYTENGYPLPGYAASWHRLFARVVDGGHVLFDTQPPDTSVDPRWLVRS